MGLSCRHNEFGRLHQLPTEFDFVGVEPADVVPVRGLRVPPDGQHGGQVGRGRLVRLCFINRRLHTQFRARGGVDKLILTGI